jgi:hypothetical protein
MRELINIVEGRVGQYRWEEPDAERVELLRARGFTPNTKHRLSVLRDRLLAIAGWAVVLPPSDADLAAIMAGQAWDGRNAKKMPGVPRECHSNSAALYAKDPETFKLCTGYAMSEDGVWRQHSWCLMGDRVVETTVSRVLYFGAILTGKVADEFVRANP